LAVVLWGNSFIATKYLVVRLTPVTIISMRLILAIFLLLIIAAIQKRNFRINLRSHSYIFLLAVIAVFHLWIQVTGLKYTSASNTGWIIGTTPIFIALLGFIFFKEKLSFINMAGVLIATLGVLLLISKGDFVSLDFLKNIGDYLVLFSSFTWGVYSIVNKKISVTYSPLMTILYLFIFMAVIILPFNINRETIDSIYNLNMTGWISILYLGLLCSGIAYVLWAQSLNRMESTKVGAYLYFEPFVTVIGAWLILNESITTNALLGGIIITAGVVLVNRES
jgi:drug/metabolite transporter (DMT)-like permease